MSPDEILKKEIRYQANYRGSKEMDFVISRAIGQLLQGPLDTEQLQRILEFLKRDDAELERDYESPPEKYAFIIKHIRGIKRHD